MAPKTFKRRGKNRNQPGMRGLFLKEGTGNSDPKASGPKSQKPGAGSSKSTTDREDPHATSPGPVQKGPKSPFLFDEKHNLVRLRRQRLADLEGADFISKWKNSDAYIGSNMLANINRWQDLSAEDVARSFGRDKVLASDVRAANQKRSDLRSLDYQIRTQAAHDRAEAFYELWKENNRNARAAKIAASTESEAERTKGLARQALEQGGVTALWSRIKRLEGQADYKGGQSAKKQDRAQGSSTSFNFDAGVKPPEKSARTAAQSGKYLDENGQVKKERQDYIDKEIAKGGTKIFVNGHELTRRTDRVIGHLGGKPIYASGADYSKAMPADKWQQQWTEKIQKGKDAGATFHGSLSSGSGYYTDDYTGERLTPVEIGKRVEERAKGNRALREFNQANQQLRDILARNKDVTPGAGAAPKGTPGVSAAPKGTPGVGAAPKGATSQNYSLNGNALNRDAWDQVTWALGKEEARTLEQGQDIKPKIVDAVNTFNKRATDWAGISSRIPSIGASTASNFDALYRGFSVIKDKVTGIEDRAGSRVGSWIGRALQTWADSNRKLPKQMKRDYTRKRNFTRIVR